jgi:tetratricopeptide (TPR) repeat protein
MYWQAKEAFEAFKRASSLLASGGNLYEAADAFGFAEWELVLLGRLEESRGMGAEAHKLASRSGNDQARWVVGNNDAFAALLGAADIDGFEKRFAANLERNREAGLIWLFSLDQGFIGRAQFWQGRWDQARESLREGTEFEFPGVFFGFTTGPLFLSTAYSGQRDAALTILQQVEGALPKPGQPNTAGAWVMLESVIEGLAVLGKWDEAARLYPVALESAVSGNRVYFDTAGVVQTGAGIAAMAGRQWEKAEEHFKVALGFAHEIPHKIAQPEVRRWYARMLIERDGPGDKEKARTLLTEAISMYREIGMPRHLDMAEKLMKRL